MKGLVFSSNFYGLVLFQIPALHVVMFKITSKVKIFDNCFIKGEGKAHFRLVMNTKNYLLIVNDITIIQRFYIEFVLRVEILNAERKKTDVNQTVYFKFPHE